MSNPQPTGEHGGTRTPRWHIWALAGLACVLIGATVMALWPRPKLTPVTLYAAVDISGSVDEQQREHMSAAVTSLLNRELWEQVEIWTFNNTPDVRFRGNPVEAREVFKAIKGCQPVPGAKDGTSPASTITAIAARIDQLPSDQGAVLTILWDGEDGQRGETAKAVQDLAKRSGIYAVWVVCMPKTPQYKLSRIEIEDLFAPLGDRLVVSGESDLGYGLDLVQRILNRHRR